MKEISIVIPNWNGKQLLKKNLPYLVEALNHYPGTSDIIIVDDGSNDGSIDFLNTSYPSISVIPSEANEGFATACNKGISASKSPIVYLLNNDIRVDKGFLDSIIPYFDNDDVFAVTSIAYPSDYSTGFKPQFPTVQFKAGIFWYYYESIHNVDSPISAFFSSGGHSAFDREKFLKLGGFDNMFHPFYWEDADISYRAWKSGWRSLYEPKSHVIHDHQSTIGKNFTTNYIQNIHWRNRFLFTWKNLNTTSLWFQHIFLLPFELIFMTLSGRTSFGRGAFMAIVKIPELIKSRKMRNGSLYTDKQVLKTLKIKSRNALRTGK